MAFLNTATVTPINSAKPRTRAPRAVVALDPIPATYNIVDYWYLTKDSKVAATIGAIVGAWIPYGLFRAVHALFTAVILASIDAHTLAGWQIIARLALVVAGLTYSVSSVSEVLDHARPSRFRWKAVAITIFTEGFMCMSGLWDLEVIALLILCACNALAMASTVVRGSRFLALKREQERKEKPGV